MYVYAFVLPMLFLRMSSQYWLQSMGRTDTMWATAAGEREGKGECISTSINSCPVLPNTTPKNTHFVCHARVKTLLKDLRTKRRGKKNRTQLGFESSTPVQDSYN